MAGRRYTVVGVVVPLEPNSENISFFPGLISRYRSFQ